MRKREVGANTCRKQNGSTRSIRSPFSKDLLAAKGDVSDRLNRALDCVRAGCAAWRPIALRSFADFRDPYESESGPRGVLVGSPSDSA